MEGSFEVSGHICRSDRLMEDVAENGEYHSSHIILTRRTLEPGSGAVSNSNSSILFFALSMLT